MTSMAGERDRGSTRGEGGWYPWERWSAAGRGEHAERHLAGDDLDPTGKTVGGCGGCAAVPAQSGLVVGLLIGLLIGLLALVRRRE